MKNVSKGNKNISEEEDHTEAFMEIDQKTGKSNWRTKRSKPYDLSGGGMTNNKRKSEAPLMNHFWPKAELSLGHAGLRNEEYPDPHLPSQGYSQDVVQVSEGLC